MVRHFQSCIFRSCIFSRPTATKWFRGKESQWTACKLTTCQSLLPRDADEKRTCLFADTVVVSDAPWQVLVQREHDRVLQPINGVVALIAGALLPTVADLLLHARPSKRRNPPAKSLTVSYIRFALHFCPQRCRSRQISWITCVLQTETVI